MPQIFTVGQPSRSITPLGSGQRTRLLTLDFIVEGGMAIFISADADVRMDRQAIPGQQVPPAISGHLQVGFQVSGKPIGYFADMTEHRIDLSVAVDTSVMVNLPFNITHASREIAPGPYQAALDFNCINAAPTQIMPRRLTVMLFEL